jgi:hypothetical protein
MAQAAEPDCQQWTHSEGETRSEGSALGVCCVPLTGPSPPCQTSTCRTERSVNVLRTMSGYRLSTRSGSAWCVGNVDGWVALESLPEDVQAIARRAAKRVAHVLVDILGLNGPVNDSKSWSEMRSHSVSLGMLPLDWMVFPHAHIHFAMHESCLITPEPGVLRTSGHAAER